MTLKVPEGFICPNCGRSDVKRVHRGLCDRCYEYNRKHGLIEKINGCDVDILTEEQNDHLTGNMLGDGNIRMDKFSKNARLCIERAIIDKEYLKWEAILFKNIWSVDS